MGDAGTHHRRSRHPWESAAVLALLLPVAACAQAPGSPSRLGPPAQSAAPGVCDAAGAQSVVGREATPSLLQEARRRSGAARVRVVKPGEVVTMEFDAGRLTLDVDTGNRVVRVRCG